MNNGSAAEEKALHFLRQLRQPALLSHWQTLNTAQKRELASQLSTIDPAVLKKQKELLDTPSDRNRDISPFTAYSKAGNKNDAETGRTAIAQGLVGCLIVAGGQGTRLGFDGPKGIFPVTLIKRKSLFELFVEKTLAAGEQAGRRLPLAIMTSEENDQETRRFFEKHHYFGMHKSDLSFFVQKSLPLLDKEGNLFLQSAAHIAAGPDGNGGALHAFYDSGLFSSWYSQGVRFLNFILIDNALADPFDAELIGHQIRTGSEIAVKCTEKASPEEKVGVLAMEKNRAAVVEYSELPPDAAARRDGKGNLLFGLANLSLFSFAMDFVQNICKEDIPLPLHKAFKAATFLDGQGKSVKSDKPSAWKFERFIFDLLPYARKVDALVYPRESCFAPLKNSIGPDSPSTVAAALEASDRRKVASVTGTPCEASPLEISQRFYYPTQDLLDKWEGRKVSSPGYIET